MPEWDNVRYSDRDVLNMQQEAIRRVRQMQQRSEQTVSQINADFPPETFVPPPAPVFPSQQNHAGGMPRGGSVHRQPPPQHSEGGPFSFLSGLGSQLSGTISRLRDDSEGHEGILSGGLGGIVSSFVGEESPAGKALAALGLDGERLLLIGLLLVLMNEKADFTLLVALFYLLL